MADILGQLMDYLQTNQTDPLTYLFVFFLFSVAAAVFLPIPVEIGLVWNPDMFFPLKALDLGLGKAVGAIAVFFIPSLVRRIVKRLRTWGPSRRARSVFWAVACKTGIDKSRLYKRLCRGRLARSVGPAPPRWGWLRWLSNRSERFARRYGVVAMYVLLSLPGMPDTIILYAFSIINKERTLIKLRDFVLANFLAGINRAFITFAVIELLGLRLF